MSTNRITLRRFWFTFDPASRPIGCLGYGVTAWTREDALAILSQQMPGEVDTIAEYIEDVDVSTLDPRHILPNVGDVTVRGIWFPGGAPPLRRTRGA